MSKIIITPFPYFTPLRLSLLLIEKLDIGGKLKGMYQDDNVKDLEFSFGVDEHSSGGGRAQREMSKWLDGVTAIA